MAKQVKEIDRGWSKIVKQTTKVKNGRAVAVGFQGSEAEMISPDHGEMTNIELAAIHEFGTKDGRIPERPMIRQTFDKHKSTYINEMKIISKHLFEGKNIDGELLLLGEDFKDDIMQEVRGNSFETWADSTIEAKEALGKSGGVPLWVTGQLMDALSTEVVNTKVKKV